MNKRYSANIYAIISIAIGYFLSKVVFKEYSGGVNSTLAMNILNVINNVVITLVPLIIFMIFNRRKFAGFFGSVSTKKIWFCALIAPVVWSASNIFNSEINLILKHYGIVMIEQLPKGNETEVLFSGFVLACIVAPVFEELLFRGVILTLLKGYGKGAAIVVSALLFAFAHGSITVFGAPLILGIVNAYITLNTGSVWPAIIIHFINNLLSWTIMSFDIDVKISALISILMVLIGTAWLIWAVIKIIKERKRLLSALRQTFNYIKNPLWIPIVINYIYVNTLMHG